MADDTQANETAKKKTAKKKTAKKKTAKKKTAKKKTAKRSTQLGSESLPRRTLEDVIALPKALHEIHAGGEANWEQLCDNLEMGSKSANTKYLFWAAVAYGVINKEAKGTGTRQVFSLSEVGRKIVAPTFDGERGEGVLKAVLTPTVLSKFYNQYNGHPVPEPTFLRNVLVQNFDVPQSRTDEAGRIILENARYAGILEESGEKRSIQLAGAGSGTLSPPLSDDERDHGAESESPQSVTATDTEWSKICFIITPIGGDVSEERKHADMMLKHLLRPAVEKLGLTVVRADKITKQGLITQQIFEYLAKSKVCITDLSFSNPNAFYELGIRHMCKLPNVQIIRDGDKIPFDVSQGRTIIVDTSDRYTIMDRFDSARRELEEHLRHLLDGSGSDDDNPVNVYLPGLKVHLPK